MLAEDFKKKEIVERYDSQARNQDNKQWLDKGKSVRVPENASAHYFVGRKTAFAIKLAEKRLKHYGINNVKFVNDDAEKMCRGGVIIADFVFERIPLVNMFAGIIIVKGIKE
jgi:hypothetical protein